MNAKFIRTGHSYPYYNAEAGWILLVCAELYNLAEEPEESLPETTAEESVISDISGDASSLPEVSAPISKEYPLDLCGNRYQRCGNCCCGSRHYR